MAPLMTKVFILAYFRVSGSDFANLFNRMLLRRVANEEECAHKNKLYTLERVGFENLSNSIICAFDNKFWLHFWKEMGNCMHCGKKKPTEDKELGKKPKQKKQKKSKNGQVDEIRESSSHQNGRSDRNEQLINGHDKEGQNFSVSIAAKPFDERQPPGAQERKILRLLLPYIPKREWGKLREVSKTWLNVVDGEWGRMHTLHLTDVLPRDRKNYRPLADHLSSKCQLSRALVCEPSETRRGPFNLLDKEFWRQLLPRTNDLTTLRLRNVILPKYFYTDFLPKCKNLETVEIIEAQNQGDPENWTDADKEKLSATFADMKQLRDLQLQLNKNYFNQDGAKVVKSLPASKRVELYDAGQKSNAKVADQRQDVQLVSIKFYNDVNSKLPAETAEPLTQAQLKSLTYDTNLTSLSFDLNIDLLDPYENEHVLRRCFSGFEHLQNLRITISSNETNVYDTLRTLALILSTVAENSHKLNTLELVRLPDPMSIDKRLATDFTAAFVKLNDETQLDHFHVCISAPRELFHVWSLPWPALTRLRTLTITDCNQYPERPRGIDLEAMPSLIAFTLRSDSLDDEMLTRVFSQTRPNLVEVTLEPGPNGLGKRGVCTVAVACQNLQHLTISYSRCAADVGQYGWSSTLMDTRGWLAFYRSVSDTLKMITLIDVEREYMRDVVSPVASQCPQIVVRPVYKNE